MVEEYRRFSGSVKEFEDDWERVLREDDDRYFIFPSHISERQVDLLEWIKVQQILELMETDGVTGGSILEYGCGAAGISLYLAQRGFDAHLCDLSSNALKVAERNRCRHAPSARIASTSVADALRLPYADDSFEAVMSFGLLEHFEGAPLEQLLSETVRVLKPGGLFIADIVPGPERLNARTLGLVINFTGSALYHSLKGRWREVPSLHKRYFDYYFENTYDDEQWKKMLERYGLERVQVSVCRPFPLLAISGRLEALYTGLVRQCLSLHRRFDEADNFLVRQWGWMYLSSGYKGSGGAEA